ncbi:MAG: hypothetical protein ACXVAX_00665 [Pseudobdellovibrio sp.]
MKSKNDKYKQYGENDIYEIKPHLYGLLALICLYNRNYSNMLFASGVLFAIASASIFYLRFFARNYSSRYRG